MRNDKKFGSSSFCLCPFIHLHSNQIKNLTSLESRTTLYCRAIEAQTLCVCRLWVHVSITSEVLYLYGRSDTFLSLDDVYKFTFKFHSYICISIYDSDLFVKVKFYLQKFNILFNTFIP